MAVLEENQARYPRDLVLAGKAWIFVGIQLNELRFAGVRGCYLLDNWAKHAAWSAPRRPKINQHRLLALQHLGVKIRLRYVW